MKNEKTPWKIARSYDDKDYEVFDEICIFSSQEVEGLKESIKDYTKLQGIILLEDGTFVQTRADGSALLGRALRATNGKALFSVTAIHIVSQRIEFSIPAENSQEATKLALEKVKEFEKDYKIKRKDTEAKITNQGNQCTVMNVVLKDK